MTPRFTTLRRNGFSLVEVAMSLGIVAFAFTALLGMLPLGLNMFRDAVETSVTSRIFERVSGDVQQSDFDTLTAGGLPLRYFDDQGNELPGQAGSLYWARASVHTDPELPGSSGNSELTRVLIEVAHNPSGVALTDGTDGQWVKIPAVNLTRRALFVARNTIKPASGS